MGCDSNSLQQDGDRPAPYVLPLSFLEYHMIIAQNKTAKETLANPLGRAQNQHCKNIEHLWGEHQNIKVRRYKAYGESKYV